MVIKQLKLTRFRLYDELTLTPHPHLNIITGLNAQGKTTILEAIHTLGLTKSHKPGKDTDLIQKGSEYAKISARCVFNQREVPLSIVVSKHGKRVNYNKIEMSKLSDYIGALTVVMFSPEDLDLVKGSPQERRRFLDLEIGQLSKPYLNHLNHYRRLLKDRNEVLKGLAQQQKYDETTLDVITEQLVVHAEEVVKYRKTFIQTLSNKLVQVLPLISLDDPVVSLVYEPSIHEGFASQYAKRRQFDILSGTTTIGPHRDDLGFVFGTDALKPYASQGQIRTVVLALKLAVVEMINNETKRFPIVLLDDVFSELDQDRQENLLKHLNHKTQVFITATDLKNIDKSMLNHYQITHIHAGKLKGVETHG